MNNKEFIAELARRTKSNTKETQQRMNFLIKEITEHLCNEDMISISNFGTFEKIYQDEYMGVHPITGAPQKNPGSYRIRFISSKNLKDAINNRK